MNSDARAVLVCGIVFPILAVLCGGARLWAKKIKGSRLGLDDWIIVLDVLLAFAIAVASADMASKSLVGADFSELAFAQVLLFQKYLFAVEVLVTFVVGTVKISVLLFYKKIFSKPQFQLVANILTGFCAVWTFSFIMAIVFQNYPVQATWDPRIKPQSSFGTGPMWAAMGTTDVLLDLCILSMPIPMVASLQLPRIRKILVGVIFALGAFCIVASGARLAYFVRVIPVTGRVGNNFTDSVAATIIWSVIESCVSVIAACLPTLWPCFQEGSGLRLLAQRTRIYATSLRSLARTRNRGSGSGTRPSPTSSVSGKGSGQGSEFELGQVWTGESSKAKQQSASAYATHSDGHADGHNSGGSIRVEQSFGLQVEGRK